jgi:hypothetical protein
VKKERFESRNTYIVAVLAFVAAILFLGFSENKLLYFRQDPLVSGGLIFLLIAFGIYLKVTMFVEIQDDRWLVNSGYYTFWNQKFDIFDVKYIYRYPNFVLKWYGSRMVFYIRTPDGKLRQSSLREVNYSNDTLRAFLKRIKQIKPSIELDLEYEKFLEEKLYLEDASQNTVSSVEARLKEKGERWE